MNRKNMQYMVVNVETGETRRLLGNSLLEKDCPNFQVYEFVSTNKSEIVLYSPTLLKYLQHLRNEFKRAVVITSAHREIAFNESVDGYEDSEHLYGLAVDFRMYGIEIERLANACINLGGYYCNVGKYSNWVHFGISGYHRRA